MGSSSKQASIVWFNKILAFSVGIATCPSRRLRRKYGESSIFIECLHRRRCEVFHTWQKDRAPARSTKEPGLGSEANRHDRAESGLTAPSRHSLGQASPPIEAVMGSRKEDLTVHGFLSTFRDWLATAQTS